jgi:hypothetical protein
MDIAAHPERVGRVKTPLQPLVDDLERVFGKRLRAVVAYGWRPQKLQPSLALVESLDFDDLTACAARTAHWRRAGCATPLLLTPREFARSLDAFPIEYDEILATSRIVAGTHPFDGLAIAPADLRRACEVQVKSHLVHLREDYLEIGGKPASVAALARDSAPAFIALLRHLARLDNVAIETNAALIAYAERLGLGGRIVSNLIALASPDESGTVDAGRLFADYLAAVEHLAEFVDSWRAR